MSGGGLDVFVTKFNSSGTSLVYSTYIGGSDYQGYNAGIAIDNANNAYITGRAANGFPTANATQWSTSSGAFIAKLSNAPPPSATTRVITYTYDGLQRLVGAREVPGTVYSYTFDLAGNRTELRANGGLVQSRSYNAANQVNGFGYDAAGNLLNDGTTTYSYDALNRLVTTSATGQTRTNSYNGDGVLTQQVANGVTTVYRQDLVSPLSQVLQTTQGANTTSYLYGLDRLAALTGSTRALQRNPVRSVVVPAQPLLAPRQFNSSRSSAPMACAASRR